MRTRTAAFASLLLLALSSLSSFGQRGDFAISSISPSVITTPQIAFQNGPVVPQGRSQSWLQIEVAFQAAPNWTDELTFKYYILLSGVCLTGDVTHVDIPRGRDLYSVMYLSPRTIARVLNGRSLNPNDIQNVGVQIVSKGQVLTTSSLKMGGNPEWWQNMQQVSGLVLNKNETPMAPLIWDRYEQIKAPAAPQ